jgi:hypothetical protein
MGVRKYMSGTDGLVAGVMEMDEVTGGIYLGDPSIDRYLIISS